MISSSTSVFDSFENQVKWGRPLSLTKITQQTLSFPQFIPTRTNEIPESSIAEPLSGWIAVDAKILFDISSRDEAVLSRKFHSAFNTQRFLRIDNSVQLLAVLNGNDRVLEGIWASRRRNFFNRLRVAGFKAITGPTFSILRESRLHPASHNVCMLFRHNQILLEIADNGLVAIPNIYWRNRNDLQRWADWIAENRINIISRDFSRTRYLGSFHKQFIELVAMLELLKDPVHILFLGVGPAKTAHIKRGLAGTGCTFSFVSADPVLAAVLGGRRYRKVDKRIFEDRDVEMSRGRLAVRNLNILKKSGG